MKTMIDELIQEVEAMKSGEKPADLEYILQMLKRIKLKEILDSGNMD